MERTLVDVSKFTHICEKALRGLTFYTPADLIHIEEEDSVLSFVYASDARSDVCVSDDMEVMNNSILGHPELTHLFMQFFHKGGRFNGNVSGSFREANRHKGFDSCPELICAVERVARGLSGSALNYIGYNLEMESELLRCGYKQLGLYQGLPRLAKLLSED